jgi:hypothetical protein
MSEDYLNVMLLLDEILFNYIPLKRYLIFMGFTCSVVTVNVKDMITRPNCMIRIERRSMKWNPMKLTDSVY